MATKQPINTTQLEHTIATQAKQIADLQAVARRVRQQDLQLENLKSAMTRMQVYVRELEKKIRRTQDTARVNGESIQKIVRTLRKEDE